MNLAKISLTEPRVFYDILPMHDVLSLCRRKPSLQTQTREFWDTGKHKCEQPPLLTLQALSSTNKTKYMSIRIYWPFIWTNLNPFHPRKLSARFGWNWSCGSRNFTNIFFAISIFFPFWELNGSWYVMSMYFHYFVIISHWKRVGPFIWTTLNPLYPRMLCAIGPVVLEKKMKMLKVYDNNDEDNGPQTYCDQKSSLWLRWTKNVK